MYEQPATYVWNCQHIKQLLTACGYSELDAEIWMSTKQILFNGQSACDLIGAGRTSEVERLIWQLRDCVYI